MEITSNVSLADDLDLELEVEGHSLSGISVNVYGSPVAGTRTLNRVVSLA